MPQKKEKAALVQLVRKLLALDQASHTSGYSIFYDDKLEAYGKFTFDDEDIGERLYKIREKIKELIDKYDINEVAFEDIQLQNNVGNNVKTFKILAEVFGIVYELVTELKIPHTAVLSGTWKSTLGIKGRDRQEQKRNAKAYVIQTYGVKPTQDEADAICIGAHMTNKPKAKPVVADHDWSD